MQKRIDIAELDALRDIADSFVSSFFDLLAEHSEDSVRLTYVVAHVALENCVRNVKIWGLFRNLKARRPSDAAHYAGRFEIEAIAVKAAYHLAVYMRADKLVEHTQLLLVNTVGGLDKIGFFQS